MNITNEDNMALMARYPDKYFDLAIVDPPYGIGDFTPNRINKKWEYDWNNQAPNKLYFIELERVSKERIIWGANYFNCFNNKGGAIVWHKDNPNPRLSACEIASYSRLQRVAFSRYDWSNTDKYNELRGADIHPCEKPVALYKWLLTNYAKQGDKILDTHLGSGSIAIACHDLGFDLTACELDAEYYKAAIKRIDNHKLQLKLI